MKFLHTIFLFFPLLFSAQTQTFRGENNKWGIKENERIIIPAVYDTLFNFDKEGNVCLACYRIKTTTTRNAMTITKTNHYCRYLNKNNNCLVIHINNNTDTCSVFQLSKNSVELYNDTFPFFAVSAKHKKYMVDKNFKQLTFVPYHNIYASSDKNFYVAEEKNEGDVVLTGLINTEEKQIIPFNYSGLTFNTADSLIIACSGSVRAKANDDIYNYKGEKIATYKTHVDMATKNFVIHKLYEPKQHYIIYNLQNDVRKQLDSDDLKLFRNDTVLIKQKNDWFFYNIHTYQKTLYKN
ncbi:MAG: hypothetical protein KF900_02470 [Bacteroidetes bacterium]|nr:hypothetical protein [Bacteroidota bacterium]